VPVLEIQHESNVQQKKATKQFHDSTSTMLDTVLTKLRGIFQVQEEFNIKMVKGAEDAHKHEQDKISLNEYLELIKDIASYIETSAGVLKSLSVGDDGVVPTVSKFVDKVKIEVSETENSLSDSKEKLSESFQNARKRLQEYSLCIKGMDVESNLTLSKLADTIKLNAEESKKKVIEVVAAAIQAASDFRMTSFETRNNLNAVFKKLEDYTLKSTKTINDRAQTQHNVMCGNLQSFTVGMQRHGQMQAEIKRLNNVINFEGDKHRKIIAAQDEMLNARAKCYTHMEEKHRYLQEQLTKNVINGVQELIRVETDSIAHAIHEKFLSFDKTNSNLMKLNGDMDSSVKDICSQVAKAGNTLTEHVQVVQDNDVMMNNAAEDANKTLTEIQNLVKRNQESYVSFGDETNITLEAFEAHEESLTQACNVVKEQRDEVSEFVSETALESTNEGLSELNQRNREQADVTNTTISNASKDMETIHSIWDNFSVASMKRFENLTDTAEEGHCAVRDIVLKQVVKMNDLNEFVNSKERDFIEKSVNKRKLEILDRRNNMVETMDYHKEVVSSNYVETGESVTNETQSNVTYFARNIIHMESETPEIQRKKKILFRDKLSSTPSSHEIIKALMAQEEEEEEFSYHVEEDEVGSKKKTVILSELERLFPNR